MRAVLQESERILLLFVKPKLFSTLDMVKEVKNVAEIREAAGEQMTMDERYRISIAYKHITGRLRTAYRTTVDILPKARTEQIAQLVRMVQDKLRDEILVSCQDVIHLLENQSLTRDEGGVFLLKLYVNRLLNGNSTCKM